MLAIKTIIKKIKTQNKKNEKTKNHYASHISFFKLYWLCIGSNRRTAGDSQLS